MPKWLLLRTATTPTPWVRAAAPATVDGMLGDDLTDAVMAVEDGDRAEGATVSGTVITRGYATYQGRRGMPCEGCPPHV